MSATVSLIRKSLHRLITEAAAEQGKSFETRVNSLNCLEYVLEGQVVTPGQAADILGVVWPV